MPELKALAREHRLRGYSRLRKAELIAFLQNNEHLHRHLQQRHARALRGLGLQPQHPLCGCLLGNQIDLHRCLLGNQNVNRKMKSDNLRGLWPPRSMELEAPLTKRQLKHR